MEVIEKEKNDIIQNQKDNSNINNNNIDDSIQMNVIKYNKF